MKDKSAVATRYDRWSRFYDIVDTMPPFSHFEKKQRKLAIDMMDLRGGEKVLDVGVGSGYYIPWICKRLSRGTIIGIDISEQMLDRARDRAERDGCGSRAVFRKEDAEKMGFASNTFDAAVTMFALTSIPDWKSTVSEMLRVVKPGGCFIVLDTGRPTKTWMKPFYPFMRFTARTFGYTYIDREIESYIKSHKAIEVKDEARSFGGMAYCLKCLIVK